MRGIHGGRRRAAVAISTALVLIGSLFQASPPANAAVATVVVNTTYWASTRADGTNPGGASSRPAVSTDGEYIAFVSNAALVAGDTNPWADVYRKNTSTGAIDWVTEIGNGSSDSPHLTISDDGRYIGFSSDASSFIGMTCEFCWVDDNNRTDIFRRDMSLPTNDINAFRRVNVGDAGDVSLSSLYWSASSDGTKFAFFSENGLNDNETVRNPGVYTRKFDAAGNDTTFIHDATPGHLAISGDGTKVVYQWDSPSVSAYAIYLTDINDTAISAYNLAYGLSANNADPIGVVGPDSMSFDGNITAFWSDGDTYSSAPTAPRPRQVYAYDHAKRKASAPFAEQIELMSRPAGTTPTEPDAEGNADSAGGALYPKGAVSNDGNRVAFVTLASDVDPSAANGGLVLRQRSTGEVGVLSVDASGAVQPVVDATINPTGNVVAFSTPQAMVGGDSNGANDVYARAVPAAPTPAGAGAIDVTLTNEVTSTYPGFSMLETDDIPATAIPLGSADEVSGAPLRSVDLAASPLRSVPLRSVPLRSVPLRSVPLRSVTLSQLPLHTGTWEAVLATLNPNPFVGVPLQAITLDQVLNEFDKQPAATGINSVTLGNVDLAATPLRSVALASIVLGATPLRSVPVPGPSSDVFTNWCTLIQSLGYSCTDLGLTADSPVLAADLAGVPLRSVPLRSVPLRSVPLRSVELQSSPLRSVPLRSVFLDGIPLGTLPLNKIGTLDAAGNLATVNPGLLVDCTLVDCATDTLADAYSADAILDGKTLGDLFDHVDLDDLPGSLAELIEGLIDTKNFPWETIPLDGLQQFAGENKREVEYQVDFDVTGNQAGTAAITVQLPPGFQYAPFSTVDPDTIDDVSSAGIYGAPVVNGSTLTWTAAVTGGNAYDFTFRAYPGFDLATDATSTATLTVGTTTSTLSGRAPIDVIEDFEFAPIFYEEVLYCAFCDTYSYDTSSYSVPAFSPEIPSNTLIASHIGTSGDVDTFKVAVPPKGTRMQIHLGNRSVDTDFDVVMLNTAADSTPLRSVPLRSVPLRSVPLADNGVDASAADSALSPETLDDIPNVEGAPLRSVGENRGVADEFLATVSDADPQVNEAQQYYTLQVSAYNGGSSNSPYVLYVKTYSPPPPPECPSPKTFANAGQGVAGTAPTLPDGLNTLFLVNQKRLGDTHGALAAADAIAKLNTLAGQSSLGVVGAVYPVESDGAVDTAMTNWDLDPCSTDLANSAFHAIGEVVDGIRETHGDTLKNIVVVGGDDIIPMARIADYTQISNESDYTAGALLSNGDGTPIAAAAATQNFLSDDPLGDTDPIPWLDHTLFVPDIAVGRLVETPAEIGAQVDQFIAAQGRLDPQKSLVTGYDFLTDGSLGVDSALSNRLPDAQRTKVINETWSKADALAALFPATGSPDIASINAHYDHTRALPALGNSTADESDLVTTAEIAANPNTLTKRLLFTMGCHAGLSVPKSYTDTPEKDADWAQAYVGGQKAAVYLANTGFGYGDTAAVALSEELMRQFALRLNGSMTVGDAAIYAKQAYFGQLGAYGPYDEKAMQEAAFYGLPMWKIGGGTTALPALPTPITPVDGGNGVFSAPVSIGSTFARQTSKGGGSFFTASATGTNVTGTGLQVTQYRPIEPRVTVDVTPVEGVGEPHGVLITDLESHDVASVPAVARPVIDLTASEPPPPAGDVSFPTSFETLTTYNTPQGERDQIVFMPGQFFRDASWANAGGVQRLFDDIDADVMYSDSTDWFAPQMTNVEATLAAGQLTIELFATDETSAGPTRVVVLVKDASGEWTLHDLAGTGSGLWSATFAVTGTDIEYFAQAVDGAGNVGRTTNKGKYFSGLPQALTTNGTPDLTLTPGKPTGSNGWYRGPVTVTLQGTPGVTYNKSVDGGAPSPYSGPITLTGDGSHSVKAVGSDGSADTVVAVIDTTAPSFTATPDRAPNNHGWYNAPVTFATSCSDATSGVQVCPTGAVATEGAGQMLTAFDFAGNSKASTPFSIDMTPPTVTTNIADGQVFTGVAPDPTCTATDTLSGSLGCVGMLSNAATPGWYTYVAIGQDKAGNVTTKTVTFKASYLFGGYLQPVNDTAHYVGSTPPPYSVFAGGSTVPLKFKLLKQDGTASPATSTPTFSAVRMGPLGGVPVNEPQVTTAPTPGNLFTFDPASGMYSFNWKTDKKTMSGYYWRVSVLIDGQTFSVLIGLK